MQTIDRRFLVETLEELSEQECDSSELVYYTDEEIILGIIETAKYYKTSHEYYKKLES